MNVNLNGKRGFKKVSSLVAIWQDRLTLNHWEIHLSVLDSDPGEEHTGYIKGDLTYLHAHLKIFKPRPHELFTAEILDKVIIHELLHLHFMGMGVIIGTPEHMAEEQAAQILSRVIWESYNINLNKRSNRGKSA